MFVPQCLALYASHCLPHLWTCLNPLHILVHVSNFDFNFICDCEYLKVWAQSTALCHQILFCFSYHVRFYTHTKRHFFPFKISFLSYLPYSIWSHARSVLPSLVFFNLSFWWALKEIWTWIHRIYAVFEVWKSMEF